MTLQVVHALCYNSGAELSFLDFKSLLEFVSKSNTILAHTNSLFFKKWWLEGVKWPFLKFLKEGSFA